MREDIGQTVGTTTLDKFSESITTPDARYKLEEYILNGSRITHNKPIADFFSGNWQGKKVYSVNNGDGRVIIETIGQDIGYDHRWGSVTTSRVEGYVDAWMDVEVYDEVEEVCWDGEFSYTVSSTTSKYLSYIKMRVPDKLQQRYMLTEEQENLIEAGYDLPRMDSDGLRIQEQEKGGDSLVLKTVPKYRLIYRSLRTCRALGPARDRGAVQPGVFPIPPPISGRHCPSALRLCKGNRGGGGAAPKGRSRQERMPSGRSPADRPVTALPRRRGPSRM